MILNVSYKFLKMKTDLESLRLPGDSKYELLGNFSAFIFDL